MNIGAAVSRKIGPLPAWGWGVAIGGAILAVRYLRGGQTSGQTQPVLIPTGAPPVDPSQGFLEQLANAVGDLRLRVEELADRATPTPPPAVDPRFTSNPPVAEPTPPPVSATPPPAPPAWNPLGISWPSTWPSYAQATLQEALNYAHNIIVNYSPGGAFYGQAEVGDKYRIPYIPTGVMSASEQYALASQYGGTAGLRV